MNLIKSTNPKLKKVSTEIDIPSGRETGRYLLKFLNQIENGLGLSAVQTGYLKRVFVIRWADRLYICINPEIKKYSRKKVTIKEGCLSYPDKEVYVKRSQQIEVTYTNGAGDYTVGRFEGLLARIFQHEFDHLNGICKVGDDNG